MTLTEEKAKLEDDIRGHLTELGIRKVKRLLEVRLEIHKENLLREESGVVRGGGRECQILLKLFDLT